MRLSSALFLPFLLGVAAAPLCLGQSGQGTISGVVTDSLGAVLPQANVALHNADNSVTRKAVTDTSGRFMITALAPAHYEVDADAKGFAVTAKPDVALSAGQALDLALVLKISYIN